MNIGMTIPNSEEDIYFQGPLVVFFIVGALGFCCLGCMSMALMIYCCRKADKVDLKPTEIEEINKQIDLVQMQRKAARGDDLQGYDLNERPNLNQMSQMIRGGSLSKANVGPFDHTRNQSDAKLINGR